MSGLIEAIRRCKVDLKLDNNTEGYGNCFPNAIVQQCRRPEINHYLLAKNPRGIFKSSQALRREIKNFALKNKHKTLNDYKTNYETALLNTDRSWMEYWTDMEKDGTWVDSVFIQVTAWYIGLDIYLLTTSSKPDSPFIVISGNFNNPLTKSEGPPLLIGNYTNVHYQSLLPSIDKAIRKENKSNQTIEQESVLIKDNFIYAYKGLRIIFTRTEDANLQCPFCNGYFSRILTHVSSKQCIISESNIDKEEFERQLSAFKEGFRVDMGRRRKAKSDAKLRELRGEETFKKDKNERKAKSRINVADSKGKETVQMEANNQKAKSQIKIAEIRGKETVQIEANNRKAKSRINVADSRGKETVQMEANNQKAKSRNKLRVERGPIKVRKEQNTTKFQSRKRKMERDPEKVHGDEKKRKKLSRIKLKQGAPKKFREAQNIWQQKHRLVDSRKKRLHNFKRNTMFNAIFTCMCCQRNLFECNVVRTTYRDRNKEAWPLCKSN